MEKQSELDLVCVEFMKERRRRRFMQVSDRRLGWGIDPAQDNRPCVVLYIRGWHTVYDIKIFTEYVGEDNNWDDAERRVIDTAINAYEVEFGKSEGFGGRTPREP